MSPYAIPPLISAALFLSLGIFVFAKNPSSIINRTYSFFCLLTFHWQFCWTLLFSLKEPGYVFTLVRIGYTGIIFLPIAFYHFAASLLKLRSENKVIVWGYIISFLFAISVWLTKGFVSGYYTYFWGYYPKAGLPLHPPYLVFLNAVVLRTIFLLFFRVNAFKESPSKFNQIRYARLALWIYTLAAVDFVCNYGVEVYPMGFIFCLGSLGVMAYAIVRHRLMDIQLLTRDAISKICALALVAIPLLIGRMLAESLLTLEGAGLARTVSTLGAAILNFSLGITILRRYENPLTRRLCRFFLLLGVWNTGEILLVLPPHPVSVWLYRAAYAVGCVVLLAWFEFWQGYFRSDEESLKGKVLFAGLRWTAYGMMALCVLTPWVLRSLAFDPLRHRPAMEVAGPAHPLFALWFMAVLSGMGLWAIRTFLRVKDDLPPRASPWVLGAFGFATLAAGSYFLYVPGTLSLPLHAFLEISMDVCLVGVFLHQSIRQEGRTPISFQIGALALTLPFVVGFLLTQGAWFQVAAGVLLVITVPRIVSEIQESVQAWVDRKVFRGQYEYLKDLKALGGSLYHIYGLHQLLETLGQGLAQTMGTKTCTVHMWDAAAEAFRLKVSVGLDATLMERPDFPNELPLQNALIRWTAQQKGPFLKEELIRQLSISQVYAVGRPMELLQAELVLPLFAEGQMRGLLTLGAKRSGAMYNQKDFTLLAGLAEDAQRILGYTLIIYEQALTTAKIAHDARQPFQPIEGWLGLLRQNMLGPTTTEQQEAFQKIKANTDFVHAFFDDLVELNALIVQRIRGEVKFTPFDLGRVLRDITAGLQPKVTPGVTLTLEISERLPHAFGHERGIHRALNNLIVNALKFTKQGMVQVGVRPKRDWLEVQVQDTGPGIPEDQLPRLFEPFGQTRQPERNVIEGMGLGLTIVKEVVALHEGQLRVENRVGEGTTFIVGVPTVESAFAHRHQRPSKDRLPLSAEGEREPKQEAA